MQLDEFEQRYGVRILAKKDSALLRVVGLIIPALITDFWTTHRLPFQRQVRITYPPSVSNPMDYPGILEHELVHARDLAKWWGPPVMGLLVTVLPLPILLSGRWFIERRAYFGDICAGRTSTAQAVETLWSSYGWCWPRSWMRKWFETQLEKQTVVSIDKS